MQKAPQKGFTLIELSIVLVIIGLIVGGVLVGQDLIRAAEIRATVSQIEKYNTAANTFRLKYGYLPGDIKDPDASTFGFAARGSLRGQGDGNGLLESNGGAGFSGERQSAGETIMFWNDLGTAHLIDATLTAASSTAPPSSNITPTSTPTIDAYFPSAKLGHGNYVYVYSNGTGGAGAWQSSGVNYYGIVGINTLYSYGLLTTTPAITVSQAYAVDKKMDDGLPASGSVTARYIPSTVDYPDWVGVNPNAGYATAPSSTTCYDNNGVISGLYNYSIKVAGGANMNCALSFQFQ